MIRPPHPPPDSRRNRPFRTPALRTPLPWLEPKATNPSPALTSAPTHTVKGNQVNRPDAVRVQRDPNNRADRGIQIQLIYGAARAMKSRLSLSDL